MSYVLGYLAVGCLLGGFSVNPKKPDPWTLWLCILLWPVVLLVALGIKLGEIHKWLGCLVFLSLLQGCGLSEAERRAYRTEAAMYETCGAKCKPHGVNGASTPERCVCDLTTEVR